MRPSNHIARAADNLPEEEAYPFGLGAARGFATEETWWKAGL